ncbi:MAG: class I SAM-dependent methyltransferase [Planctomycetota bacterium]|jgi:ubiquinone/menaquinone biosynthesis C-methylase UbiE
MNVKPIGAGKSSFDLIDPPLFFDILQLDRNLVFLDVACGIGNYSLAVAEVLGENSIIFAIDLWAEGISSLLKEISKKKINNIWTTVGDISKPIPLNNQSIDICLMATVLHDLVEVQTQHGALKEIARVLKPGGQLAIIPPGPPIDIRLTAEEVENIVAPYGFLKEFIKDVGPYNYLAGFTLGP